MRQPASPDLKEVRDQPAPRDRAAQPYALAEPTTAPAPPAPASASADAPAADDKPATGDGGSKKTNALSAFGKLGNYNQDGSRTGQAGGSSQGVTGGSLDGSPGAKGSFEARGSALAQACLDRAGVFLPTDNFAGTFRMRADRPTSTMTIIGTPALSSGSVANATVRRIELALNRCRDFSEFVYSEPSVRKFNLQITASSLTSRR